MAQTKDMVWVSHTIILKNLILEKDWAYFQSYFRLEKNNFEANLWFYFVVFHLGFKKIFVKYVFDIGSD